MSRIRIYISDLQPAGRSSSLYPNEVKSLFLYVCPQVCSRCVQPHDILVISGPQTLLVTIR